MDINDLVCCLWLVDTYFPIQEGLLILACVHYGSTFKLMLGKHSEL